MADGGVSKCGRKAALSTFFVVTFTAFTLSVISLISPSWQYVSLENGRTEHHHGLWLDCKRDYSFDYGRTREYYETLYRRDLQGSPFDIFFLPPLHCVYKFDYYIDPEDLYDHNHDENRIQNDAYQHLFLAILSTIGVTIFYAWANYQDNKVIKEEEDTIYEQMLGWAFYCQVVTTIIHWLASMLGCCVTSVSFSKTRAKLVKIEVVEGGDESQLLSSRNSSQPFKRSFSAIYRVDSQSLRQWERDYMRNAQERQERQEDEVWSSGARKYRLSVTRLSIKHTFKRTTSMPYYSKKQRAAAQKKLAGRSAHDFFSSTSNITETTHTGSMNILERNQPRSVSAQPVPPANPTSYPAAPKLKSALKTPQQSRKSVNISDSDITYEYLPCDDVSIGVSTLPSTQPPHGSSQSIPVTQPKTTLIDDVARPSSFVDVQRDRFNQNAVISTSKRPAEETKKTEVYERIQEAQAKEKTVIKSTSFPANPHPESKPPLSIRDFGIDLTPKRGYCDVETTFGSQTSSQSSGKIKYADLDPGKSVSVPSAPSPLRYISVEKVSTKRLHELSGQPSTSKGDSSQLHRSPERPSATPRSNDSFDSIPLSNAGIAINTFGDREKQRCGT
ncbi:Clc-like protein [Ancylostoma ceylanicum]|uniref:Clc-like protein n=1 Tax=Ancylostoma ceylanicum TaxID=53326 RepID=A0A0D6M0J2_9BILA|nr:Clc-like protein [Ancylostoma ceylanicum]